VSKRERDLIDKLTALRAQVDEVVEALMPAPVGARGQLGSASSGAASPPARPSGS
jgi:hypothetical protein